MSDKEPPKLPHLLLKGTAATEAYTSRSSGGGPKFKLPERNRPDHATKLLSKLDFIRTEAEAIGREQAAFGLGAGNGICIQFESSPEFELWIDSLENKRAGIELLCVKEADAKTFATVFVPEGKLERFVTLVTAYMEEDSRWHKPKNKKLVESINDIRMAAVDALWTDSIAPPADGEEIWWEVWLRGDGSRFDSFKAQGKEIGLHIPDESIEFPDRTVALAKGTKAQVGRSIKLLNAVAELRKAKDTADFFTSLSPIQQSDWMDDAAELINGAGPDAPAVCILDTGVNNEHPLLRPALEPEDMHTCDPGWGVNDHKGHGTEMAGLALYGDLTEMLSTNQPIDLRHRLESVKLKPPVGENPPHLYGARTTEAISRAEVTAPERKRIVCMAVSATDDRDRGRPSSWSGRIDALSSGADDDQRRLIIVSAGNTDPDFRHLYPDTNKTDLIHDPGQSWNALTVGAYTEKDFIDTTEFPDWHTIAPPGDLSPSSCTSWEWQRIWPVKPDIVMEGGNMALNPGTGKADYTDSLSLLSTNRGHSIKPFSATGDTSAATALASRMAAILHAEYPHIWPETVRALMIHSAEWTDSMLARFPLNVSGNKLYLLRYCGYGVPDMNKAMWSASNSLTLMVQGSLQPFDKVKSKYKSREMHLHKIPWPEEVLMELGETPVEMRVTLSYFIEPSPGERGWKRKYSYASHQLRFDVITPEETVEEFRRRVNQEAWDEEHGVTSKSDSSSWVLGSNLRKLGSVHSDIWRDGTAAGLASRGYIAVYPVIGWWRERHHLGRWNKQARYSLIVTIKTPETEMDIYTPVENMVATVIQV